MQYDIAIIGGGAAGLMAAITARRTNPSCTVVILEKSARILRKLLSTGNGRCNLTNEHISPARYYGESPQFAAPALSAFGTAETLAFFDSLGVPSVCLEKGRMYPMSLQATSVADALRFEAEHFGVTILTDFAVQSAESKAGVFELAAQDKRKVRAKRLIVTTGGCAAPELGANISGYGLLESLGHSLTRTSPALCQLRTEKSIVFGLQGIKVDAAVSLLHDGKEVGATRDELLFTDQGLSGTAIFELSVLWHVHAPLTARIDFMPDIDLDTLAAMLRTRRETLAHLAMEQYMNGLLHKKLGQALTKFAGVEKLSLPVCELSDAQIEAITRQMKQFEIAIIGPSGFKNAQVTAGGIRVSEFDPQTMASAIVPNLYAAGEVLDIYGDCGGFNLQWAWASGRAAGLHAAQQ